jgi:hypothetical protein
VLDGDAVAIGLEGHHAEAVGPDRDGAAAREGMRGQRQKMRQLLVPQLSHRRPDPIGEAPLGPRRGTPPAGER